MDGVGNGSSLTSEIDDDYRDDSTTATPDPDDVAGMCDRHDGHDGLHLGFVIDISRDTHAEHRRSAYDRRVDVVSDDTGVQRRIIASRRFGEGGRSSRVSRDVDRLRRGC